MTALGAKWTLAVRSQRQCITAHLHYQARRGWRAPATEHRHDNWRTRQDESENWLVVVIRASQISGHKKAKA
jgi:hypothetical protein